MMPASNQNSAPEEKLKWLHLAELSSLPYSVLFLTWLGLAMLFAILYYLLAIFFPDHGPILADGSHLHVFLDSLYFSIITATSTGYGDITPQGFSKLLASLQSISALFVFAMFVTKLVAQRQEIALQEVHRLTYQDIVHNTRGDLFIVRKDLDFLSGLAKTRKELTEEDWETLKVAYKQAQNAVAGIPEFYDGGNTLYQIDARREELLLESVHRTLHRINQTLDIFSANGIHWEKHKESTTELLEFITLVHAITPVWQERSPYGKKEAFEEIMMLKSKVHDRCEKVVTE